MNKYVKARLGFFYLNTAKEEPFLDVSFVMYQLVKARKYLEESLKEEKLTPRMRRYIREALREIEELKRKTEVVK